MADSTLEIERIVREVVAQLLAATNGSAVEGNPAAPAQVNGKDQNGSSPTAKPAMAIGPNGKASGANGSAPRTEGDYVVQRRVVTLAELPERLDGVRRLVVPPRAVVTPAVHDVLDRKHIPLVFASASDAASPAKKTAVCLVAMGNSYDPTPLVKVLSDEGYTVKSRQMDCLIAASDHLAEGLRDESALGVLVTKHPAAAMCLTNRLAGVRAVRGTSVDAVASDAAAVGANLLVIDPKSQGFFPTKQMVVQFLRGGPRSCPEVFVKRLG